MSEMRVRIKKLEKFVRELALEREGEPEIFHQQQSRIESLVLVDNSHLPILSFDTFAV